MQTWKIWYIVVVGLMGLLLSIKIVGFIVIAIECYLGDRRARKVLEQRQDPEDPDMDNAQIGTELDRIIGEIKQECDNIVERPRTDVILLAVDELQDLRDRVAKIH